MAGDRIDRINEEIQRELASLIPMVKDPRVTGMISVMAEDTTTDLRYAKVFISILDKSDEQQVMRGLKSAAGWLRRELGHRLQLRYTPELSFVLDESIDKGAHILLCSGIPTWSSPSTRTTTMRRSGNEPTDR